MAKATTTKKYFGRPVGSKNRSQAERAVKKMQRTLRGTLGRLNTSYRVLAKVLEDLNNSSLR
jgi:hypothetical protein